MGHQFYTDKDETIFQIEIKTKTQDVNNTLLFGFKAINDIANLAKTKFTHSILVIHFNKVALPIVAESNLKCSKNYFIYSNDNEKQWRNSIAAAAGISFFGSTLSDSAEAKVKSGLILLPPFITE